jgi:hypothetical protein
VARGVKVSVGDGGVKVPVATRTTTGGRVTVATGVGVSGLTAQAVRVQAKRSRVERNWAITSGLYRIHWCWQAAGGRRQAAEKD